MWAVSATGKGHPTTCSFCGKRSAEVGPMVEGPGDIYMCANCVELAAIIIRTEKTRNGVCTLCQRPASEVGDLAIALGGALVCPVCLDKLVERALVEKQQQT
jgi:hypothetical protein